MGTTTTSRLRYERALQRGLLKACPDELPRPEPELTFITDEDLRLDVEAKLHTAWVNFKAGEWLGATAFAGVALEAMLPCEVKQAHDRPQVAGVKRASLATERRLSPTRRFRRAHFAAHATEQRAPGWS